MNTKNTDQAEDVLVIDWASALPRRPGTPPRRIVTPATYHHKPSALAPIQLVDTIALDPSDRRTRAKAQPSLTWTIVKAGLILAVLIAIVPALLRLLAVAGIYTFVQLNR